MDNSIEEIIKKLDKIESDMKELRDWMISCKAVKETKDKLLQVFRWIAPWALAFLFVLFQHKIKI